MILRTLAGDKTELGVIVNGSQKEKQRFTLHVFVCCS